MRKLIVLTGIFMITGTLFAVKGTFDESSHPLLFEEIMQSRTPETLSNVSTSSGSNSEGSSESSTGGSSTSGTTTITSSTISSISTVMSDGKTYSTAFGYDENMNPIMNITIDGTSYELTFPKNSENLTTSLDENFNMGGNQTGTELRISLTTNEGYTNTYGIITNNEDGSIDSIDATVSEGLTNTSCTINPFMIQAQSYNVETQTMSSMSVESVLESIGFVKLN